MKLLELVGCYKPHPSISPCPELNVSVSVCMNYCGLQVGKYIYTLVRKIQPGIMCACANASQLALSERRADGECTNFCGAERCGGLNHDTGASGYTNCYEHNYQQKGFRFYSAYGILFRY